MDPSEQVRIRPVSVADVEQLAELCGQLGYPSTPQQVRQRLEAILHDPDHAVLVAEIEGNSVVGWIHLFIYKLLVADPQASLGGLVVAEAYRGRDIGQRLLQAGELWAEEKGCWSIYLRSNVIREQAHLFYEKRGFERVKTQLALRKRLLAKEEASDIGTACATTRTDSGGSL
jgi:GNAT superfamily N-acetyltransferase